MFSGFMYLLFYFAVLIILQFSFNPYMLCKYLPQFTDFCVDVVEFMMCVSIHVDVASTAETNFLPINRPPTTVLR